MKFVAREGSIPLAGSRMAAVDREQNVVIYDYRSQSIVAAFETNHKIGGKRLAYSDAANACLTGSYHAYDTGCTEDCGVACYSPATGERKWLRSDLKRVQRLRILGKTEVFAGFNDARTCILDSLTGKTIEVFPGVKNMWKGVDGQVVKETEGLLTITSSTGEEIEHSPMSFAVLDVAMNADQILISESGGPVRCFSVVGKELWQYTPPKGSHVLYFGHGPKDHLMGVQWPYERGGDYSLHDFSTAEAKRIGTFEKTCLGILPGSKSLIQWDLTQIDIE